MAIIELFVRKDPIEAGDGRFRRASTGVDEDLAGGKLKVTHCNLLFEARVALIDRAFLYAFQRSLNALFDAATMPSLRAFTACMSTVIAPFGTVIRGPPGLCAACALATSAFVGMQPVLTQVPPKSLRSMMATRIPAAVRRPAGRTGLAGPYDNRVEVGHD